MTTVPIEITPATRYTRLDVLRILHLRERQLQGWERAGLVAPGNQFTFQDLVQLRKLRDLRATHISSASIRASVSAMQRVSGVANPLLQASAMRNGSRLAFRHSGHWMDPVSQQLLFDFAAPAQAELAVLGKTPASDAADRLAHQAQAQEMFQRAVQLEENPATLKDAVDIYEEIIERHPNHAPACINLGTIHYNRREFVQAEHLYRRATVADPEYALAMFDLGNALDELQRLDEAITAYQAAIRLVPNYADAHYNLALAYERQGERRRALRHWLAYVRLDPVGPWATHARLQAKKILGTERLAIVSRRGQPARLAAS